MPISPKPLGDIIPAITPVPITREDIDVVVVDHSGNRIKQIPNCTVDNVEWDLNDVDSASISFPAAIESLVDRTTAPPTVYPRLRKDEIQIWHKGNLMFWGVPWRRRVTGSDGKCQITCEGVLSYLKQLFVSNSSIDFSGGFEQASIAVAILEYAQGHGFGNQQPDRELNITYPFLSPTGHVRARLYDREQHANLLDLLKEFPTLKDGFDWALIPYADGRREFTIFYPQRGSRRANLVIEMRRNLGDLIFDEDATKLVNESWFSGASDGILKVENTWIDTASASFYGIAQHFSSDSTEYDVQWLLSEAQHETETYASPAITPELTGLPTPVALLGVLTPGDTIPVRIDDGQVQVRDDYRITKITWAPGDGTGGTSSGGGGDSLKINCLAKRAVTPVAVPVTSPNPKASEPQTFWFYSADEQIEDYGGTDCIYPLDDSSQPINPVGTYNNIYWGAPPFGYWYNFEYDLTIDFDLEPGDGRFCSCQFWFNNGSGGYIGLQTGSGSGGGGPLQKSALFSIWDAIGATGVPGGQAGPFSGEGTGYHASIPIQWIAGRTYRLGVWINGVDGSGNPIWEGYITDTVTNINYVIGDITVPAAWSVGGGENGYLAGQHLHWVEYFSHPTLVQCSDIPVSSASFTNFQADQGTTYGKAHPTSDGPYFGSTTACANSRICTVPGGRRMQLGGQHTHGRSNSPFHGADTFAQQFEILLDPVVDLYTWETLLNYFYENEILRLQVLPAQTRPSLTKGLRVIASNNPPGASEPPLTATSLTGTVTTIDANNLVIDMDFAWTINTLYTWEVTREFGTNTWKVVIDDGTTQTTVAEVTMANLDGLEQDTTNTTYLPGTFASCSNIEQGWAKFYVPYLDGLPANMHNNLLLDSNGCNNTLVEDIDSLTVQHIVGVS